MGRYVGFGFLLAVAMLPAARTLSAATAADGSLIIDHGAVEYSEKGTWVKEKDLSPQAGDAPFSVEFPEQSGEYAAYRLRVEEPKP